MNALQEDKLYHISLLDGQARALIAQTTNLCDRAREIHTLSRTATAALGRHLTAAALLGAMLKGEKDSVTCAIKGGGPLGTLMAVANKEATVKGYADHPEVDLPRKNGKLDVGGAVGRAGRLTVIRDMGLGEPYVGQVNLVSGEIAEDYAMYFTASEQTPSLVSLGVLTAQTVQAADGLIVQMLPGASEEAVRAVEAQAPAMTGISATLEARGLDGAVEALLGPLSPVRLATLHPSYQCDCTRERIERALISMGKEELQSLIDDQGGAEVGCQFCNKLRRFSKEDLQALLQAASAAKP